MKSLLRTKKALVVIIVVIIVVCSIAGSYYYLYYKDNVNVALKRLGYNVSQPKMPFAKQGYDTYQVSSIIKTNIDPKLLKGKVIMQDLVIQKPTLLQTPAFYKGLLYSAVLPSGNIKTSMVALHIVQPYPNVFYLYNKSHNENTKDYVIVFVPNKHHTRMQIFEFTISPIFMKEAVASTLKPFVEKYRRKD